MSKPYHESALCRYRVRAAKAVGKLPVLTFDEADELYGQLIALETHSKRNESARRISYLADAVYDHYLRPRGDRPPLGSGRGFGGVRHETLEFRDNAWYRWTLVNDIPVEFRKLDPQPEAPNR